MAGGAKALNEIMVELLGLYLMATIYPQNKVIMKTQSLYIPYWKNNKALFERDSIGMPNAWLNTACHAIRSLTAQFNSINMLRDYLNECYIPTADYHKQLKTKNMTPAKELAQWKQNVASRFSTIKINEIVIDGAMEDTLIDTNPLTVAVNIEPGSMTQSW